MKRTVIAALGCLCAISLCSCKEMIESCWNAWVSYGDSLSHQEISFEEISDWALKNGWRECYIKKQNGTFEERKGLRFIDDDNSILKILINADRSDVTGGDHYLDREESAYLEFQCQIGDLEVICGDYVVTSMDWTSESWTVNPPWCYKVDEGTYQKCLEVAYGLYDAANQAPNHAS